ncbi:MAG TPA: hypothetical protein VM889_13540 [Candidatus Thermoplasmatota archaeon]|nr:hypothetical protein [Candidatus Thermoplasmatota archaeon]
MTPRRAAAFSPGHVTGFFEIRDEASEWDRKGSRGAGFATKLGALSFVEVEPARRFSLDISLDKSRSEAPVTRHAVREVLKAAIADGKVPYDRDAPAGERAKVAMRVFTETQLPVSQGFGMSAAGALSAAMAAAKALGVGRTEAVRAAHAAEIANRSGLGDVAGAIHGGWEIRRAPGLPPYGAVQSFMGYGELVLCVVDEPLETKSVLADPAKRRAINAAGARAVDALLAEPTVERFFDLSHAFAIETGLLKGRLLDAVETARQHGHASMSMLGGSLFAVGRRDALLAALKPFGETFVTEVDPEPARILPIET